MGILNNIFRKSKRAQEKEERREEELAYLAGKSYDSLYDGVVGEVERGGPSESYLSQEGTGADDETQDETVSGSFVMGVTEVSGADDNGDIVIRGNIKGNAEVNMMVSAINFGDDDKSAKTVTITGIEKDGKTVNSATDQDVTIKLGGAGDIDISVGTVLYTEDIVEDAIHDAYVTAIGDVYVKDRVLDISDEEYEKLSLTDCAEIWRLNTWYMGHAGKDEPDELKETRRDRISRLVPKLCSKIMDAEAVYYVHDKQTGEAHLFSQTINRGDGTYTCTPANILIVSKAYRRHYRKLYKNDKMELAIVRNGDDRKGIYNFLAGNFYINGASGVAVNVVQTSIPAAMLVGEPDNEGIPKENIPVTNPDLVKWMLLIGQLDSPGDSDETALIYKLYYKFMGRELLKSKLIIPLRNTYSQASEKDDDDKDVQLDFARTSGKNKREAVVMYTDWRRLRSEYGRDWDGMIHTVSGFIDKYDCAINPTKYPAAGYYLSKLMYDSMVELSEEDGGKTIE